MSHSLMFHPSFRLFVRINKKKTFCLWCCVVVEDFGCHFFGFDYELRVILMKDIPSICEIVLLLKMSRR